MGVERQKLTKSLVEGIQPGPKDIIVWDREVRGFGVKITPTGRRVYFVFYRTATGQQRKPTIGTHGSTTAENARQIAKTWIAGALVGQDVSGERKVARTAPLVKDLAQRYLDEYAAAYKKPSSYKSDKSMLDHHVLPLIGTKKVAELRRSDIELMKTSVRAGKTAQRKRARYRGRCLIKGGPGVANRTVSLLSRMMTCAMDWDLRTENPALRIKKYPERRKDRFLDSDEIQRLLAALREAEQRRLETPDIVACFVLLLFTGLRLGEILHLKWDWVDLVRKNINFPDSKTGARIVPLNNQAYEVLRKQYATKNGVYVIKSSTGEGRPSPGKPWERIRGRANIDSTVTINTLRHTFASWSVMGGLSLPQTGALLGHKSAQTTLRYADHLTLAVRRYSQQTANLISSE